MISVIVPAHNAGQSLGKCLKALADQTIPTSLYEVIVVDDGSEDGTGAIAEGLGASVITQPRSWPAAARNAGIELAAGEIVCFTDADCAPKPDWLEEITAPFADPSIIGCKGTYATNQKEIVARFVQLEYEDKYDLLRGQSQIDFIDTYSASYRRDVLLANDGFDQKFPYLEDQELSFRLSARGYKMVFRPEATVYHLHSDTLVGYLRKKFRIGFWKAQVVRRFPERGLKDSHTPQSMKVQMGLMALLYLSILPAIFTRWAVIPLIVLALLFLLTSIPFSLKAWKKDRTIALLASFFMAARASALGLGYSWGVIRPRPGVSGEESTIGGLNYLAKRLMDIAGGLIGLSAAVLLSPFIGLAIKATSPGPMVFRQKRIGQGGRPFTMYKFRSMRAGAQEQLTELVDINELPEPAFKLEDDPRVTPVGHVLRRWSLDELPQFWNVFIGEMSLVGPRPEEAAIVALYNDIQRRRLSVKPGLTGPMQVYGRGDLPLNRRLDLELDYIDNYTVWRDIRIIILTIPALLSGKGAR
jgi:lipopolysaccharide/colanic/teichoic acid biosynthesis glycosyltransferase/glycosyltransferase involved in cell wall biosynthesis